MMFAILAMLCDTSREFYAVFTILSRKCDNAGIRMSAPSMFHSTVTAHQESAPDHRVDLTNPYVNPVNLNATFACHHGTSLTEHR